MPLYSFGHGLSYSKFVYEGLELSSDVITSDSTITAKVKVRNDSNANGKETVMLYMRDLYASNARPVQQLIAFQKVEIAAGEVREMEFNISEPMLRFWNNNQEFVSEPGVFEISTGYADHLVLTTTLELER